MKTFTRLTALFMAYPSIVMGQNTPLTDATIHALAKDWCNPNLAGAARDNIIATHGSIKDWDVSQVTNMVELFSSLRNVDPDCNPPIMNWDTGKVTTFQSMFNGARKFNQNIGGWNTEKATSFSGMFTYARAFNQDIGGWNTSEVTDFSSMFRSAENFNQNIGGWKTDKSTTFSYMFRDAGQFNQNIGGWNTEKATTFSGMFNGVGEFNQNIGGWNTEKVTKFSSMFRGADKFNQDIGGWNTEKATTFTYMFREAGEFNQNIGGWNTEKATTFFGMFYNAGQFNQYIGNWNVTNAAGEFGSMFQGASSYKKVICWEADTVDSEEIGLAFNSQEVLYSLWNSCCDAIENKAMFEHNETTLSDIDTDGVADQCDSCPSIKDPSVVCNNGVAAVAIAIDVTNGCRATVLNINDVFSTGSDACAIASNVALEPMPTTSGSYEIEVVSDPFAGTTTTRCPVNVTVTKSPDCLICQPDSANTRTRGLRSRSLNGWFSCGSGHCVRSRSTCEIDATTNEHYCSCLDGYAGAECRPYNECNTTFPCPGGSQCIDMFPPMNFKCVCESGYIPVLPKASEFNESGVPIEYRPIQCLDKPECDQEMSPCHENATCTNTIGGYECECAEGLIGNGVTNCEEPEQADTVTDPPPTGYCITTEDCRGANMQCITSECLCLPGYAQVGPNCQNERHCDPRGYNNNCHAKATCIEESGYPGFSCSCVEGWEDTSENADGTLCTIIPPPQTDPPPEPATEAAATFASGVGPHPNRPTVFTPVCLAEGANCGSGGTCCSGTCS